MLLLALLLAAGEEMAPIPAGEFTMGRTKLTRDDSTGMRPKVLLDDRPARKVKVDAFALDKYEVTNERYAEFLKAAKRPAPRHWVRGELPRGTENYPVYNVDWDDASAYCKWVGKRLPTEAEWERAARSGKEDLSYPWGDKADAKLARFNVQTGPGPVGQFPANEFGVYDIVGNVAEWLADWYEHGYYQTAPAENPKGPGSGMYKVIRGGAWSDPPARLTVYYRNWVRPNQKTPNIGFRCAR